MKAEVLYMGEKGKIELRTIEIGEPGINEVLVEMKACGICTGDIYYFGTGEAPRPFGHEGVGIVIKTSPGVLHVKPGDKVFCLHGGREMGQLAKIPAASVIRIPDEVENYPLWVGEPITCIVNAIDQLHIIPGSRIAIIGMGFMGLLNVQGFTHTLAGEILAFDMLEDRLALAQNFGVDKSYNTKNEDTEKVIEEIIATGGADIVVEASGSEGGFKLANQIIKTAGTLSLFGCHRGIRQFDGDNWHSRGIRILNTSPSCDTHYFERGIQAAKLMQKGVFNLKQLITHVSDYRNAQELFEIALHKKDGYIKGVITF